MKKIGSFIISFVLMFMLFGCGESKGLEAGFLVNNGDTSSLYCAYKTTKTTFNKNKVILRLYFGFGGSKGYEELNITEDVKSVTIRILLSGRDNNGTTHERLIKEIGAEEFFLKKYKCTFMSYEVIRSVGLPQFDIKIEYNHSEKIKVPEEFFSGNYGSVSFVIKPYYTYYDKEPDYGVGDSERLFYKIDDNKVTIALSHFGEM